MIADSHPARTTGTALVLGGVFLSWLGFFVHNVADLPGQTILSPESAIPTLIFVLLAAAWLTPARRIAAWVLLGWNVLHLVGGAIVSVLPLPILPFSPSQTLYHYTFHAVYGLLQLPLLVVLVRYLRGK